MNARTVLPLIGVPLLVASCGGGTPAEKIRPADQTFAAAMGESGGGQCREPESGAEPLVVDWKPEQRGDLEVLMKDSVAVVSYSCKGFKLLKDCKVDGKYGFLGMTKKEQVVTLSNADEVKANLPLAGAGIAASIGAEMARGATLDVALIMIGKVKTTWGKVAADELKGECDGATHFVKGATVGAFVMETGAKGQAKTAAQLFGAGASGGSSSAKHVRNQDGDLSDCGKSAPDSPKAPAQCQAIVRLELKAIGPKGAKAAGDAATAKSSPPSEMKTAEVAAPDTTCPKGLVLAEGKCTEAKVATAFLCNPKDGKQCIEQCSKGHAGSCGVAGALLSSGGGGVSKDDTKARELFGKACDGGDLKSCTNFGLFLTQGRGGAKDPAGALKSFERSCNEADAAGCGLLGAAYASGEGASKDEAKAVGFLQRGCEGGHEASCSLVGRMLFDGRGATKDVPKGLDFMKRGCDGGQAKSCFDVANAYDGGAKEVSQNAILAKMLYQRACMGGSAKGCSGQGRLELGPGGSPDSAKRAYEMGCNNNDDLACAAMKVLFGGSRSVMPKPNEMQDLQKSCMSGNTRDCGAHATLQIASGQPKQVALPSLERACMSQDPLACAVKKK